MAVGELARRSARHPHAPGVPGTAEAVPNVVLLLSQPGDRARRVRALERAGYRVSLPRQPVEWVTAHRPACLVTDDTDGAARLRATLVDAAPDTPCVVLADDPTPTDYRRLLARGATALPASCPDEDLVLAVGAAVRALTCLPVAAARALAGVDGHRPSLTDREASWLRALVDGATVAGLARASGYSAREMYRVLGNLYARLGADNRTEALLLADRWGLLAPPGHDRRSRVPEQRGPTRS